MSSTADRLAGLSPKQRALLLRRLQQSKAAQPRAVEDGLAVIAPQPRDGRTFPLSFSQLREWILDRLEPGTSAYNIPTPLALRGALDVGALRAAVDQLEVRHESLRTRFATTDGEPGQVVEAAQPGRLRLVDLSALPAAARAWEARRRGRAEAGWHFDLSHTPLYRVVLLRLDEHTHHLLLTIHHIVSDGWSTGIFAREMTALYEALAAGRPVALPPLPIQYADFAVWQRRLLQGASLERLVGYWREQLQAPPPPLELPADRPRPAVRSDRGGLHFVALPAALRQGLHGLARQRNASLFMVALAALKALFYRYTGRPDLALGTFVANRNRSDTAGLIGFFVNTLVLRTRLTPEQGFGAAVDAVRETTLGAYGHQDLPFEKLLEELQPPRDPSRTPFFQVLCVLQNMPIPTLDLEGLTVGPLAGGDHRAHFDLTVWLQEVGGELAASLDYSRDLFDATTVTRLAAHWQTLMRAALARPEAALDTLSLLGAAERHQLRCEWNDSAQPDPSLAPVPALFAAQAARTPEAVAVIMATAEGGPPQRLRYRELAAEAARIAHRVHALGSGPETIVAIALGRGPRLVAALLGVLQAGAAYLPLDPEHPAERLAFQLADAGAAGLLTEKRLAPVLAPVLAAPVLTPLLEGSGAALRVLYIDDGETAEHDPAEHEPTPLPVALDQLALDQLAYVLYTSGSTGRPKGVQVSHRALANYVWTACRRYGLGAHERVLQFAAITFDASAEEIYPVLLRGGSLLLRGEEVLAPAELTTLAAQHGVTVLDLPTAYWHRLIADPMAILPACVRRVILGGEAVHAASLVAWRQRSGARLPVFNTYGPTEATIVATAEALAVHPTAAHGSVAPIGRPLANVRAHLVDGRLRPVPVGVVGEVVLAGAGIARGYRGRPALTAARFVPDALAPAAPGSRLYRSGDLARHLGDGRLVFVGRADLQVKVRGFRIELEEIETALRAHPRVGQAAVLARRDPAPAGAGVAAPADPRLVAYVVGNEAADDETLAAGALRAFLGDRLPGYMVPALFVFLDALPLNAHGKVDRRALPAPEGERPTQTAPFVAPQDETERAVAAVWHQVLGVERVGVRDNFFELGGDSLRLVQVHQRLVQEGASDLRLIELFRHPTVESLARRLRRAEEGAARPQARTQERIAVQRQGAAERRRRLQQERPRRRPPRERR